VRIPVKAGSRLIGVAFVERDQARDEATVRPRMRGRGSQPALLTVTIAGPYDAKGPGDTAARRRIFVCRPANAPANAAVNTEAETPCARKILSTLVRRAYRRPGDRSRSGGFAAVLHGRKSQRWFRYGHSEGPRTSAGQPQFLFRIEHQPEGIAKGSAYRISDLELASRLSFFLWSSIPDDELLDAATAGKLKDPATLERETRRMLADPRSESLVTNFAAQWLFLRDVELKQPDVLLFPDFDDGLR